MARVGSALFVSGVVALAGYAVLTSGTDEPEKAPPANTSDEVTVTVKATFYGHTVFGQGSKGGAPFVTTALGVVTETEFPTGLNYRKVYKNVKRGTVITVTVSPGENTKLNFRQGCSIFVDGVMRSGPPVNDEGQAVISPEFQNGTHAAICNAVAS